MEPTIQNSSHTRRRMPHVGSNYRHYVHIIYCPNDPEIHQPIFPRGGHFDRSSFAATLQDNSYPGGMIVNLFRINRDNKQKERWLLCKVYVGNGNGDFPYLHECDEDGYLVEGGLMFHSTGTSSPNLVEFEEEENERV